MQNADPVSDYDAIEKYLRPKDWPIDNKGVDKAGSNGQSSSDASQQNVGLTSSTKCWTDFLVGWWERYSNHKFIL